MPQSQIANRKSQLPKTLGYRFPAEWEKQRGTWMSWPRPEGISFPGRYHHIGPQLAEIVRQIALRQEVHINVPNENWEYIVRNLLDSQKVPTKRVFFHHIKTNEAWCRDHGPAFLVKSTVGGRRSAAKDIAVIDWGFNAWGGKYPPYDSDDAVPTEVAKQLKIKTVFHPGIIMEGGAVDFNGAGTVLTTTDCLLNKNRNPKLSKPQVEQYLKDYYGQSHVCWLTGGIAGDDTDGHIDDLARFISPTKIVFGLQEDKKSKNYAVLRRVRKQLDALVDQDGKPFEIVELPMPADFRIEGDIVPATYMNFLFVNGAILVPIYNDRNDYAALSILQQHLPNHEVVGIDCTEVIWGLGAIHCLTQQMPG
jgi:agmatine deiminase